jgi:hypothetical protein
MAHAGVDSLILDLLEWVSRRERTYEEVMDAWRTCPTLPAWEEANERAFVAKEEVKGRCIVTVTSSGIEFLAKHDRLENHLRDHS